MSLSPEQINLAVKALKARWLVGARGMSRAGATLVQLHYQDRVELDFLGKKLKAMGPDHAPAQTAGAELLSIAKGEKRALERLDPVACKLLETAIAELQGALGETVH